MGRPWALAGHNASTDVHVHVAWLLCVCMVCLIRHARWISRMSNRVFAKMCYCVVLDYVCYVDWCAIVCMTAYVCHYLFYFVGIMIVLCVVTSCLRTFVFVSKL